MHYPACLMILLASREAPHDSHTIDPVSELFHDSLFPSTFSNSFLSISPYFLLLSLITALMSLTLYMSDEWERLLLLARCIVSWGFSSLPLARGHTSNKGVLAFSHGFLVLHYWKTIFIYSGLTCFNFFFLGI